MYASSFVDLFRVFALFLGCIVAHISPVSAQWISADSQQETAPQNIEDLISQHAASDEPGASIIVVKDGVVLHKSAFGKAILEHDVDISPETVFNIASVAKQFTAYAILVLSKQNHLALDDAIQKHLPEISGFSEAITIRHLIHHMSGLKDDIGMLGLAGWRHEDLITNENVLNLVSRQSILDFEPGYGHMYSNTNYSLLASIVERVTEKSFVTWTQEHIFEPLGMTDTQFVSSPETIISSRATGYEAENTGKYSRKSDAWYNVGPGSLYTNVVDLAKWVTFLQMEKLDGETVLGLMSARGVRNDGSSIDYAFGLVHGVHEGLRTLDHGGSVPGMQSSLRIFPEQGFASIVLSNQGNGDFSAGTLNAQIASLYLADEIAAAVTPAANSGRRMIMITTDDLAASPAGSFAANPDDYDAYAGTYELALDQSMDGDLLLDNLLIITRDADRLLLAFGEPPNMPLAPIDKDRFILPQLNFEISFQKDDADNVDGLLFHITEASFGDNLVQDIQGIKHSDKALTVDELSAYTGAFYGPELETIYRFNVDPAGHLNIQHPRHGTIALKHLASDKFLADTHIFTNVDFQRNAAGIVEEVYLKGFSWSSSAVLKRVDLE